MSTSLSGRLICLDDSRLPDSQKGLVIDISEQETSVGRGNENSVVISHGSISRKHALIAARNGDLFIHDLNSTNGVRINGEKISEARLGNGDTVAFGSLLFRFKVVEPPVTGQEAPSEQPPAPETPPEQPSSPVLDADPELPPDPETPVPETPVPETPETEIIESEVIPEQDMSPDEGEDGQGEDGQGEDEEEADEEDLADRTMLFGDERAGQAILDAREKVDEEPAPPAPETLRSEAAEPEPEIETEPVKTRKPALFALLAVLICIAASTWWFVEARRIAANEAVVNVHVQEIEDFATEHETWNRHFSYRQYAAQLVQLDRIITSLEKGVAEHPRLDALKPLLVEAHFYKLEREVRALLEKNQPEEALDLVDQVRVRAQGYLTHPDMHSKEDKAALNRFISLTDLLETTARYKLFQKKFPEPPGTGRPGTETAELPESAKNEIASAKLMKQRFADLLKENNLALKVRFRLLRGMAEDADEHCVLLVNRWYQAVFGAPGDMGFDRDKGFGRDTPDGKPDNG